MQPECFNRPKETATTNHSLLDAGRAPVASVMIGDEQGILRHYHRGGMMNKFSKDKFFWTGIIRTRAVKEYRLLEWMTKQHLPVPYPLGARVIKHGLFYTCDLITREIRQTQTLAARLHSHDIDLIHWRNIGVAIKTLHAHQVFHADLNANNILIDSSEHITIIDFDKCELRDGTSWQPKNISRLERSLDKLTKLGVINHFHPAGWQALLDGYRTS